LVKTIICINILTAEISLFLCIDSKRNLSEIVQMNIEITDLIQECNKESLNFLEAFMQSTKPFKVESSL
jgi:hypothetical protein